MKKLFTKTLIPFLVAGILAIAPVLSAPVFADNENGNNGNQNNQSESSPKNSCRSIVWLQGILPANVYTDLQVRFHCTPDIIPPIISSISVTGITDTKANIHWKTNEKASGSVTYGTTTAYGTTATENDNHKNNKKPHAVVLKNLQANTAYHYQITSRDSAGNVTTSSDATFTTGAPGSSSSNESDNHEGSSGLRFISQATLSVMASGTVSVTWTTNADSSSQVNYGATNAYGSTMSAGETTKTHTVILTGLTAGTTYHYQLVSTDASGKTVTSGDASFTTPTVNPTSTVQIPSINIKGKASLYDDVHLGSDLH